MSNDQLEMAPAAKDLVLQNDNTANLHNAVFSGNGAEFHSALNKTNDAAQNTVNKQFGDIEFFDSSAKGAVPEKNEMTARPNLTVDDAGTAVEVPEKMTARPNLTVDDSGTAVEVPEKMTARPNLTVDDSGMAVAVPDKNSQTESGMVARPDMTVGADGLAVEVPTAAAEAKINHLVDDMKSHSSPDQVAADLQAALKGGANLQELVEEVNNKMGKGFNIPHFDLKSNDDGSPNLTYKPGAFGGNQIIVNGNDVKLGTTYR